MTHPQPVQGTLRDALFMHLAPVWLAGDARHKDIPLRNATPHAVDHLRPLMLWALFDHPVTFVRLRLGAAGNDRYTWLGFQTTVTREVDADRSLQATKTALRDAESNHPADARLPDAPPPLPPHRYVLELPPNRKHQPQGNLTEVLPPVLCDFMEALNARGNRTVLDLQLRTTTVRPALAEALDVRFDVSLSLIHI